MKATDFSQDKETSSTFSSSFTSTVSGSSLSKHAFRVSFSPTNKKMMNISDTEEKMYCQRSPSSSLSYTKNEAEELSYEKEETSKSKMLNLPSSINVITDTFAPILPSILSIANTTNIPFLQSSSEVNTSKNHFFRSSKKEESHTTGSNHTSPKSNFSYAHLYSLGNTITSSVSNIFHPLQKSFTSFDIKHITSKENLDNHVVNDVWPLLCTKTLPLFKREGLMVPVEYLNKLVRLHIEKRCNEKRLDLLINELHEFIEGGIKVFDVNLSSFSDEKLISRLVELWSFFFTAIIPYVEAIFLPLQTELDLEWTTYTYIKNSLENKIDLDVKYIMLTKFRDNIILPIYERLELIFIKNPSNLDLSHDFANIAPKLLQSILILASVHSSDEQQKKMDNLVKILSHWFKSEKN
ncbi:hypothetical protein PNEG_01318 [Pneumocystis murina B123]|uniref:HbrB-like protein n=1 Tax=Pneumocystis murina (strain B123) TaxID=1069680 RepID=M7P9R5_PNEMU|nr:hypothetical protein PNEG_01318 [Pneumocystis murina B123]EMR10615.1 hypothetical protein PNEG_01318 [Pneumocystis murina B123]